MSNKPFDLEKALAGEPLKDLHNGEKCWFIGESKLTDDYIFQNEEGECFAVTKNVENIRKGYAMWEEPRPRVQLDLPAPLKEPQEGMYVIDSNFEIYKSDFKEGRRRYSTKAFAQGRYFATREDAQEWLDALRNARR